MKNNWQTKKLGEVANVKGGGTPPTSVPEYFQGNRNWFTPTEIPKYGVSSLAESQRKISLAAEQFTTVSGENSVLLSSRATIGTVGVLSTASGYNQGIKGIEPHEGVVDPWYLAHYLRANTDQILSRASGTTFKEISTVQVRSLEIPLPPISEQKLIAKTLDEVFEKLEKAKEDTEKNLQNSRELFESYLSSIFENPNKDWGQKELGEVCQISSKLVDPRDQEFIEMLHVGGANIESKSGALINLKTAREEKLISGKFIFDEEVVLYSKIRPYLMKVAKPDFKGLCSADIYPLSVLKNLDRDYLFYLLLSPSFTHYAVQGSGRAGMPKVNREHLFVFSFYLPTLVEQKVIVKKLDLLSEQTKKLEEIYKQKLADLEELKKSILQKAFAGELVN